jgi:hypothetical protein
MRTETTKLSRHQTKHVISCLKKIFEKFHVSMDFDEELDDYLIYNNDDIYWHYTSIHEMLFGSCRMRSLFDFNKFSFGCDDFLNTNTGRLFKLLMSLKSNTIEELDIKLDLISMECS